MIGFLTLIVFYWVSLHNHRHVIGYPEGIGLASFVWVLATVNWTGKLGVFLATVKRPVRAGVQRRNSEYIDTKRTTRRGNKFKENTKSNMGLCASTTAMESSPGIIAASAV